MGDIAAELEMPVEKVEAGLAALEAQPRVVREAPMRRIAEAWLEGQRACDIRKANKGLDRESFGRESKR